TLHEVSLTSQFVEAEVSGRLNADDMEVTAEAILHDLTQLDPRTSGAVEVEASLVGPRQAPRIEIAGRGREIVLVGKPFRNVVFEAAGLLDAAAPTGNLSL